MNAKKLLAAHQAIIDAWFANWLAEHKARVDALWARKRAALKRS